MDTIDSNIVGDFDLYPAHSIQEFLIHFNKKLGKYSALLEREREALTCGSADEIDQAAKDKLSYMQALSEYVSDHFSNFANTTKMNIEQSLKVVGAICSEKNISEWDETQKLLHLNYELSDGNSITLANRLKSTNSALNTLYSLAGINQTNTYDDSGHSKHSHTSRKLASV